MGNLSIIDLKWIQLTQTIVVFIIPALIVACCASKCRPFAWWKMDKAISWKQLGISCALILVAAPCINLLAHLNEQIHLPECLSDLETNLRQMEDAATELTIAFMQCDSLLGLLANIGLLAILPGLAEEITFRGTIQRCLNWQNKNGKRMHIAIWITAILFSAIHMQFYGFIPRMLLGAWFGYVVWWTGSLWIPIAMHITNNLLAVLTYTYMDHNHIDVENIDSIGTNDTLWIGILSCICIVAGIYYQFKICKNTK